MKQTATETHHSLRNLRSLRNRQLTLNRIDMLCRMLTVQRLQTDPWGWERILDRINTLNDTYRVMTMFQEKRVRTNRDKPLKP